jgi:hypothetical protein
MAQTLSQAISSNPDLLVGYKLTSSKVGAYIDDTPIPTPSPTNNLVSDILPIVLGVCIPLISLAMLILLILGLMRRRKKQKKEKEEMTKKKISNYGNLAEYT